MLRTRSTGRTRAPPETSWRRSKSCKGIFGTLRARSAAALFACLLPAAACFADHADVPGEPRPVTVLDPRYRGSVLRGWRTFQTSFAEDGMACVHCHPEHRAMRGWAGAYPKALVFDGTPYRVKGLRQVVLEALERHTDLPPGARAALAEDLVAYIAWWGDGRPVKPGRSRPLPPAEGDLAELRSAVERGRRLFRDHTLGPCSRCHRADEGWLDPKSRPLSSTALTFPRYVPAAGRVLCLESYLSLHLASQGKQNYTAESETVTDLAAYLMHLAQGETLRPGGAVRSQIPDVGTRVGAEDRPRGRVAE